MIPSKLHTSRSCVQLCLGTFRLLAHNGSTKGLLRALICAKMYSTARNDNSNAEQENATNCTANNEKKISCSTQRRKPRHHWRDISNQRMFFEEFAKKHNITSLNEWGGITCQQVIREGG
eukprot:CAMPEP_0206182854 /NCGR_PEP_ID=MMETSP0166-20121206/300_1 /ASSEMBLY_ACC=CAM_ASM_000260 /TAXON_ID=95228 /ORGANISM="Vannella robusta, Strain DIVA3 518/3/11/1/6" /LENGTH=119 /DNA_ID=CAMNT_0053597617 /DNA_START=517 /DNA_END=872 /DNA_ORIENTATION=-